MHTQQRNSFERVESARFWKGVAQITRNRRENFYVTNCDIKYFSKSPICSRVRCEGNSSLRLSPRIDVMRLESCAGIARSHFPESRRNDAQVRIGTDNLPPAKKCKKALFCRPNLNRGRRGELRGRTTAGIESGTRAIPEEFDAALSLHRFWWNRRARPTNRGIRERDRSARADIGASVAFSTRFCRVRHGVSATLFRCKRAVHICRLRLAAASGISARNGDVAEWLKAAVC